MEPSGLLRGGMRSKSRDDPPGRPAFSRMEGRMPTLKWRLYIYTKENGSEPKVVHIHRQKGYLFGKDRRVADIPTDHQTCSKQHAVLHYRQTEGQVKPYVMDLESLN